MDEEAPSEGSRRKADQIFIGILNVGRRID